MSPHRFGLIGYGHWGKNLARAVANHPHATLASIADAGDKGRAAAKVAHPTADVVDDAGALIADRSLSAIVITSPAATHFPLAMRVIEAGKHVLITKPVTETAAEAAELRDAAARRGVAAVVDHTFLYHPCVTRLKAALSEGWLGAPLIYDTVRTGLGIYKVDADIIADLAVHDLAIMDHLFGAPQFFAAQSYAAVAGFLPDNALITATYASGLRVHIRSSWLSPLKQRLAVLVGAKQMIVWDDALADQRLRAFDSGVDLLPAAETAGRAPLGYRNGESRALPVSDIEPLRAEVDDLIACITSGKKAVSSLEAASRVMGAVQACQQSAARSGIQVAFPTVP